MNLSLRAKLRLPELCSKEELHSACSRYFAIYQGVLDSASDPGVKAIARSKLDDLVACAKEEGIRLQEAENYDWGNAAVTTPASVEAELSRLSADGRIAGDTASRLRNAVSDLPDSSMRHYLSAVLALRTGESSVDTYRKVIGHLKEAVSRDPENPVYPMVIADMEAEIDRYSADLALWRKEQQELLDAQRRRERIKKILSVTGNILMGLATIAFSIAAGVLSCMCSMLEGC